MNNTFLNIYIDSLTKQINKNVLPTEFDLIFDGGAFNGIIGQGVGLYIKSLVHLCKSKVIRVSGASIGGFLATMFLSNMNYDLDEPFKIMSDSFKKTLLLSEYHILLKKFIFENFKSDDLSHLTKRLYISYWDMKKRKQIVVSKFRNRKHLLKVLIRSSHIPYISTKELKYKGRYIDGITPYIFRDKERQVLFVSLVTRNQFTRALVIQGETTAQPRVLKGIMDANDFFTKGKSDMCSYIENWNFITKLSLRLRELIICILISFIEIWLSIKHLIPKVISQSEMLQGVIHIFKKIYMDIMEHFIY